MGLATRRVERVDPHHEGVLGTIAVLAFVCLCTQEAETVPLRAPLVSRFPNGLTSQVEQEAEGGVDNTFYVKPKKFKVDAFYKDKSWNLFASDKKKSSFGVLGKAITRERTKRFKQQNDWAESNNKLKSGGIVNFLERRPMGRDKPTRPGILNPKFRSFRGRWRRHNGDETLKEEQNRKSMKTLNKLERVEDDSDSFYDTFSEIVN